MIDSDAPKSSIRSDEPVFLIRAKDIIGGDAVRAWADLAEQAGASKTMTDRVRVWADEMDDYRERNFQPDEIHPPDAPDLLPFPDGTPANE
jgi:hypothetical protein